ncbi:DUF4160 domain-containing protein [Desulfonatronum parangueonense]
MPRVSMFFGIVIYFYYDDHPPPHFHALYEGLDAQFDLQGNLIQGYMPSKRCGYPGIGAEKRRGPYGELEKVTKQ